MRQRKSICIWEIRWDEISVGEQIGQGAFGAVFKGSYANEDVAIKYIGTIPSLLREAELLR